MGSDVQWRTRERAWWGAKCGVYLWWMMIWCVMSTKQCVTTDVSQFLIRPCTFLRFQGLHSMTLSVVIWVTGGRILWGYTKLVPRYDKCLNNGGEYVGENSLKNVESDNNKILYETLLIFFYSETVHTFWISLVYEYKRRWRDIRNILKHSISK